MIEGPASTQSEVREFPCGSCGARLEFAPGTSALVCTHCGAEQTIAATGARVVEQSFREALARVKRAKISTMGEGLREVACSGCGAKTVLSGQASACPFCDSPIVLVPDDNEAIVPQSLLPFHVDAATAATNFATWVRKLWFAPGDLAKKAKHSRIDGVYLPFYTFDTRARVDYTGQRGEHYWETEYYTEDGKRKSRQVRKTRWYSASGTIDEAFDDLLVCASRSLPAPLVDRLEPWDLASLRPFDPAFLSGFMAERAAIDLTEGFDVAQQKMVPRIESSIRSDIGGDEQRIWNWSAAYHGTTFKPCLLPLWISSFRYADKVYRVIVNARTGEVGGERPWSTIKIALAVVAGLVSIAGIVALVAWLK